MPFWSDATWRALPSHKLPVDPYHADRLEEAKYIMAIGHEVYLSTEDGKGALRSLAANEVFAIEPGQFAFIITHETVRIPFDAIGFISINARVKFRGLVNISGFHVDPGYHGKLLFSVSNAGPGPVYLRRGEPIFPLWLGSLDKPIERTTWRTGYENIDTSMLTSIAGAYTSVYQLSESLRRLRNDHDSIASEVVSLRSTRLYLNLLVAIILFLFGGVVAASFRYVVEYVVAPLSRPAPTQQLPAPPPTPAPAAPTHPAPPPQPQTNGHG